MASVFVPLLDPQGIISRTCVYLGHASFYVLTKLLIQATSSGVVIVLSLPYAVTL